MLPKVFPRRSHLRVLFLLCAIPLFMSSLFVWKRLFSQVCGRNEILRSSSQRDLVDIDRSYIHSELRMVGSENVSFVTGFALPPLSNDGAIPVQHAKEDDKSGAITEEPKDVEIDVNMTQMEDRVMKAMQIPWKFNSTLLTKERREMQRYFELHDVISLTKQDALIGSTFYFHYSPARYIFAVPRTMYNILPERKLFKDLQFNTCAVVGNSGILLHSNCGGEIDSHDFIIRCNFAVIDGFERDVGRRTDFLTFNPSILNKKYEQLSSVPTRMQFQSDLSKFGKIILWIPAFAHHNTIPTFRIMLDYLDEKHELNNNLQVAIPGNFLEGMFSYWETQGISEQRLSTGLVMYSIAVGICREVHMYGFYPFKEFNGTKLAYHYDEQFLERDFDVNKKYHRMPAEFEYFQSMHSKGALKTTVGKCNNSG